MSRANFVQVQLAAAATDIQTTLSVNAPVGGFVLPPVDGGRLVLTDSPGRPDAFEVISYTSRSGSGPYTLNGVTRGLEGTVGLAWNAGAYVLQSLTVGELDELMDSKLDATANAVSATKLQTARTINGVAFDGSANITVEDSTKLPLTGGTVTGTIVNNGARYAIEQSGEIGGAYGGWNLSRMYTVQVNCSRNDSVYGGIRWTKQGERHLGAIDCYSGGSSSSAPRISFHVGNTTNAFLFHQGGHFVATGNVTAAQFNGSGAGLTSLNANNLASGTIPDARLSGTYTGVNITGNAATATRLQTARTIGGVAFDGTANINLPGVNTAGNQSTSGNAATATRLQTARTINGVSFNGTANITVADSTKLPLTGGMLTGPVLFASPGNENGVRAGNGDNASPRINNLKITSWFGIGFGPSISGQGVPLGEYSHWMNVRDGDMGIRGSFTAWGNVTSYSDVRLKKDIRVIPDALAKVKQLSGVTYERIDSGERQTGVIAQEVQAVLPEAVMESNDEDKTLSVAYGNLVGLLVEAIKELNHKVDRQAREIAELRAL